MRRLPAAFRYPSGPLWPAPRGELVQKALPALTWRGTAEALQSCAAVLAARRAWREAAGGSPPGTLPGPQPAGFAVSGVPLPRCCPRCPLKSSPLLVRLPPLFMVFVPSCHPSRALRPRARTAVSTQVSWESSRPHPLVFRSPSLHLPTGSSPGYVEQRPPPPEELPSRQICLCPPPFAGSFPTCDFSFSAAFFLTLFQMRGKKLFESDSCAGDSDIG